MPDTKFCLMPSIALNIGLLPLAVIIFLAFLTGFALRGKQLHSSRRKILELEKEMLSNHARILELEKEKVAMLQQMKESKIPVIPLKSPREDGDKSRHAR